MFEHNFSKNLQPSEELQKIVRRHRLVAFLPILAYSLLILLDFFFLTILFQQKIWGVLVFLGVMIIAILGAFRSYYIWSLNAFALTDQRVMDFDQKGLFYRVVSAATYDKIQDVSYQTKGLWQSLWQMGTVNIQTAGNQANLELKNVARPGKVVEYINSKIKDYQPADEPPPMATQEFVTLLHKMRQSLGDKAVNELIARSAGDIDQADEEK
ncbi:MAG: PH domain-containing protein [Patescibacteria group bacterium]